MLSPSTLGIIGAATGILGAITGAAGCITGLESLRRSQQTQARDLRLELRKRLSDIRGDVDALPALFERARLSRSAVRSAMGRGPQSGDNVIWKGELENDLKTVQALTRELPDASETYQSSKPQELEDKLVEAHSLAAKAAHLRNKYETALASDDKDRDHIRANAPRGFK
jgi:hypothetical protein